jgi:SsrA-binding protein
MTARRSASAREPTIENRRARHDFFIDETLECGIRLTGTEIKSVREGRVSLAEGYVRATADPPALILLGAHIAEYPPAGPQHQHDPLRPRTLLAHAQEIRRLARHSQARGATLVPLKLYFVRGRAKLLVGLARGRRVHDKRQQVAKEHARREIERAMSRRSGGGHVGERAIRPGRTALR